MHSNYASKPLVSFIFFWLALVCIYIFAWQLQTQFVITPDVDWLILASKRMLAGGTYINDFFETNPPLILYLSAPIVFFIKFFSISTPLAVYLYIIFLGSLSLSICYALLQKIFSAQDKTLKLIVFFSLAVVFFLVPQVSFGQREHLLIILSMPYFLLSAWRLQNNFSALWYAALGIGFLAGIAFAIKPFFLTAPLLIEIYFTVKSRSLRHILRVENSAIFITILVYLTIVFFRHSDYIHLVIPLFSQSYYQNYAAPWLVMLISPTAIFTYFAYWFYLIRIHYNSYKPLVTILLLATFGFLLSYILQKLLWDYHALPALSLYILLNVMLFFQLLQQASFSKREIRDAGILAVVLLVYLIWNASSEWIAILFHPGAYFLLLAGIFACVILHSKNKQIFVRLGMSILYIGITYKTLLTNKLQDQAFFFITLLTAFCFVFILKEQKRRYIGLAVLGILIFSYPINQITYAYSTGISYKMLYSGLHFELQNYSHNSIYFITDDKDLVFPSFEESGHEILSRFGSLWALLPPVPSIDDDAHYHALYEKNKKTYQFIIQALASDLTKSKPDYIFIDTRTGQREYICNGQVMDYLKFLSQENNFNELFKNYQYVKTAYEQPLFRFDVYQRRDLYE